MKKNVLVSMCLLGINCRYDGKNNLNNNLINLLVKSGYNIIPICPEQLGGLTTPREPNEVIYENNKKKVINSSKKDVTDNFNIGAYEALKVAEKFNVIFCILKSKSPSCGKGMIYDGTFSGTLVEGSGVTADVLKNMGYKIFNENQLEEINEYIKK